MHNTLLINKIEMEAQSEEKIEVFFQIGEMDQIREKLMDFFNNPEYQFFGQCLYRYNGITLNVKPKYIPEILSDLINIGVKIYSVYQPYKPV